MTFSNQSASHAPNSAKFIITISAANCNQTISSFSPATPITYANGASFALSATGGASGNAISFASSTPTVCTVSGNVASIVSAGTCNLSADQAGNGNYHAAAQITATVTINKANQTISSFSPATPITYANGASFALTASGDTSGNTITFGSSSPNVCSVTGSIATMLSAGACILTADQAGNNNYHAAAQATATVTINKISQTITFNALADQTIAVALVSIRATASSALAVSFGTNTADICTVSAATVTILAAGTCTIIASQPGNAIYAAAADMAQTFIIDPAIEPVTTGLKFWYHDHDNIHQLDADTGTLIRTIPVTPATNKVVQLQPGNDGTVWVLGSERLQRRNGEGGLEIDVTLASLGNQPITAIALDPYQERLFARSARHPNDPAEVRLRILAISPLGVKNGEWPLADDIRVMQVEADQTLWILGHQAVWNISANSTSPGRLDFSADLPAPKLLAVDVVDQAIWLADGLQLQRLAYGSGLNATPTMSATAANKSTQSKQGMLVMASARFTLSQPIISMAVPFNTSTVRVLSVVAAGMSNIGSAAVTTLQGSAAAISVVNSFVVPTKPLSQPQQLQVWPGTPNTTVVYPTGLRTYAPSGTIIQGVLIPSYSYIMPPSRIAAPPTVAYPSVKLTNPATSFQINLNSSITLTATASALLGTISHVEFYVGGNLFGRVNRNQTGNSGHTYSLTWTPTSAGDIHLTSRAVDDRGIAAFSNLALNSGGIVAFVQPINQSIHFTPPASQVMGTNLALTATATSGLAVTFSSASPGICTVSSPPAQSASFITTGQCLLQADQPGNNNYHPAPRVTASITVGKQSQSISHFTTHPASPIAYAARTHINLTAIGGASGNPVIFASSTPGVCTVTGAIAIVQATGNCTLSANQAGNTSYDAAPQITRNLTISQGQQLIRDFNPPGQYAGIVGDSLTLSATGGASGNPVIFNASPAAVCVLGSGTSSNRLTVVSQGTCAISANQAGNNQYEPAPEVRTTIDFVMASAQVFYIHADHLGTPRVITKALDNTKVWEWSNSDPFGNNIPDENPNGVNAAMPFKYNLRFPGQYYDQETGMHYNYFRDYDPTTGRYAQSDPVGLSGGINTYAYVGSAPLVFFDPLGLQAYECKRPLGSKPGPNVRKFDPLYHRYSCVKNSDGTYACGGQTIAKPGLFGSARPTTPKEDYYDSNACKVTYYDNTCFEKCLQDEWEKERSYYGAIWGIGTSCKEYDQDINNKCRKDCGLK